VHHVGFTTLLYYDADQQNIKFTFHIGERLYSLYIEALGIGKLKSVRAGTNEAEDERYSEGC
jgi:hypothetical protein